MMRILILFMCGLVIVSADFMSAFLQCHNDYRRRHGVPALYHNPMVSSASQQWANYMAQTLQFGHSNNKNYGENIYYAWSSAGAPNPEALAKAACDDWYSEIKFYDYNNPRYIAKAGHFTAMVWRSTTQLGGGYAISANGAAFVVANYSPKGNIVNPGYFNYNVLRPRK